MKFSELQNWHEMLLEQEDLEDEDQDISAEILIYIKRAKKESVHYSPEERDNLRANIRYWAPYVSKKTGKHPDTELPPPSEPRKFTVFLQSLTKVFWVIFTISTFILGLTQIPKVINLIRSSATSTYHPQIVIYDKGGIFFITLFGIFAIIVILVQIILFRKQTQFFGGVGVRVTSFVEGVRKTFIGGGKRGKPLAILKITDGPPAMIGQELKIYTEVIKLGRDPQRADMVFYGPDTNSSISGLHALLERVNNAWRIVSVSQSRSETFVEEIAIPFNEPYPLQNGQTIRLGYLAKQPVIFKFAEIKTASKNNPQKSMADEFDYRKTDVRDDTMPADFPIISRKKQEIKPQPDHGDDIFNEFRDDSSLNLKKKSEKASQLDDSIFDEFRDR